MDLSGLCLLPWHLYALWALLVPCIIAFYPPNKSRKWVACGILGFILYKAEFIHKINSSERGKSIPLILQGVLFNLFFYTFNLFFLVEFPEWVDYRVAVETRENVKKLRCGSYRKLKWAINRSIICTLLGKGWNFEIKQLPVAKDKKINSNSNSNFLIRLLIKNLTMFIIFDAFFKLYLSTDYIQSNGWASENIQDLNPFVKSSLALSKKICLSFASVYCVYFGITIMYNISVLIQFFIFKNAQISDFKSPFGSFNGVYTIRTLWGNFWHKLMYPLAMPQSMYLVGCDYMARHLNIKPRFGTEIWRKYLLFALVFTFTGLFHAMGTLNLPWDIGAGYNVNVPFKILHGTWMSRCFFSFFFFQMQFVLIVIEEFMVSLYQWMHGPKLPHWLSSAIGILWIGVSEIYLLQSYIDEVVKGGFDIRELDTVRTPVGIILGKGERRIK